ncbi:MAG: hypothetical protein JRH20_03935, partial [Deltaproteobacteria bacterium]|nr:hypothetical protein [Deltaproteobacteria bacterium]
MLEQTGEAACPFLHAKKARQCDWPSSLTLSLGKGGGGFEQAWKLYRKGLIPLPGDAKAWPQEVRVDGRVAPVVDKSGRPHLVVPAGAHRVKGRFIWDALPQVLRVPTATGLVALALDGKAVPFPRRDAEGGLLLSSAPTITGEKQRLDVVVHRRVEDEIPMAVTTRIKLDVAGAGREVVLGQALLPGFVPMALDSKLPARLEAGGKLRIQVRPGKWELLIQSRQTKKNDRLQLPKGGENWPTEEIWVFVPRPKLRLVEVGGVGPVDPQQTTLLDAWKRHSSYRVLAGQVMTLEQRRRGDAGTALDQLKLQRTLWVDFDGKGLTIADALSGTLQRALRLEMQSDTKLGRVASGNKDQFITQHGKLVGVELSRGPVNVAAESRYEHGSGDFPAVGWNHDVQSLSATLHLPPGWQLFSVSGVDNAPGSWIGRWTLLDMFMVLVLALALGRLFGWKLGVLALVTLVLTFTEGDAPRWIWPFVIAFEALRRVLPGGWFQKIVVGVQLCCVLGLLAISIPFVLQQVRQGMYPALEHPYRNIESGVSGYRPSGRLLSLSKAADQTVQVAQEISKKEDEKYTDRRGGKKWRSRLLRGNNVAYGSDVGRALQQMVDPNAVVQTGPGLPGWSWNQFSLRFNGPVRKAERVGLLLLSPALNFVLGCVRAGLMVVLLFLLFIVA